MAKRRAGSVDARLARAVLEDPIPHLDPHLAAGQMVIKVTAVSYFPGREAGEYIGAFTFPLDEAPMATQRLTELLQRRGSLA
jgi:hypothetical protein